MLPSTRTGLGALMVAVSTLASVGAEARQACLRLRPGGIRTLAYVTSRCHTDAQGQFTSFQSLKIRRGDCPPVTVAEFQVDTPVPDPGLCRVFGESREGDGSIGSGAVHRMAVTPDGSTVVFEVTDEFSLIIPNLLPADRKGIFAVRADGSGLRRLAPASRDPSFRTRIDPVLGFQFSVTWTFPLSSDGSKVVYTDRGPGPGGEDAVQVVVLDLASGRRTQLTQRSPLVRGDPRDAEFVFVAFVDDRTVGFEVATVGVGTNNNAVMQEFFTVKTDGSSLRHIPPLIAAAGGQIVPQFAITGGRRTAFAATVPGTPTNGPTGSISEVFILDGTNLLQLTSFRRNDTGGAVFDPSARRVYFAASADPFGTNSAQSCQLFSVGALGGRLRQLTRCSTPPPTQPCGIAIIEVDARSHALVFGSQCDPFGRNPSGHQLFAMRTDGTRLRQLTDAAGYTLEPDGAVTTELPGPFAYSARR